MFKIGKTKGMIGNGRWSPDIKDERVEEDNPDICNEAQLAFKINDTSNDATINAAFFSKSRKAKGGHTIKRGKCAGDGVRTERERGKLST